MVDYFKGMTFTCMICGDERPNDMISVAYRPLRGLESQFPDARVNLRYCNDRVNCTATAHGPGPWPEEAANVPPAG